MARCTSTFEVPSARGKRDAKGELIMVAVRCEEGAELHAGPHHNGHEGQQQAFTHEWG